MELELTMTQVANGAKVTYAVNTMKDSIKIVTMFLGKDETFEGDPAVSARLFAEDAYDQFLANPNVPHVAVLGAKSYRLGR